MNSSKSKILIALLSTTPLFGCTRNESTGYQGYVEAEFIRVAAPFSGTLEKLQVRRGDKITAGAPLFILEQQNEAAARHEAEENLHAAEARLKNLKYGKRPVELDVIKAQMAQAAAAAQLSATELKRDEKLRASGFISQDKLDASISTNRRDRARVAELSNQLKSAQLPSRDDEISAQAAAVDAARAQLVQQTWKLAQKTSNASKAGLVFDTLYTEGEWVPAGSPVVSLLPPGNVKLRFFVPETIVGSLSAGRAVVARCDGCNAPIAAKISYISPQAEFTPPVIYSNESRAKLVFLVEAHPEEKAAEKLHPGQPIEIRLP
ncbi:MAG: HlyD family efflux transporter periplasmic adaptor subunit [Pseudomonadota bacterium]